jgi:hypothetical protein
VGSRRLSRGATFDRINELVSSPRRQVRIAGLSAIVLDSKYDEVKKIGVGAQRVAFRLGRTFVLRIQGRIAHKGMKMSLKVMFGDERVMARALDRAVDKEEFSRDIFSGNGLRSQFSLGYRKPRTPAKRAELLEQTYQLADILGDNRKTEIARRRDQAILTALNTADVSQNDSTLKLNGKTYALLDMGGRTYKYVDVSDSDKYEVRRTPIPNSAASRVHIVLKDENGEKDLGRVIVDPRNLRDWIARASDGTPIDPDFAVKIKKQSNWNDDLDDDSARDFLRDAGPGTFRFYPSSREGVFNIAYNDVTTFETRIKEVNNTTGYIDSDKINVFTLIESFEAAAQQRDRDTLAHQQLSTEFPGSYLVYPSSREGIDRIAYKAANERIYISDFIRGTGKILDSEEGSEANDVSSLVQDLSLAKEKLTPLSPEQSRQHLIEERRKYKSPPFSQEQISVYMEWKAELIAAQRVAWDEKNLNDFRAILHMLRAVDSCLPSDIYHVLGRIGQPRAESESDLVMRLRQNAAQEVAKNPNKIPRQPSAPVKDDSVAAQGSYVTWQTALDNRTGVGVSDRAKRLERYDRIMAEEKKRQM